MDMTLRNLALNMLDDEQGISEGAFFELRCKLDNDGQSDIVDAVEACEGRFYLTEENASRLRGVNKNTEPQETEPMFFGRPIGYDDICNAVGNERGPDSRRNQHVTVEIDGEYYQASLAITKEDDILDAGHLVIKPIL